MKKKYVSVSYILIGTITIFYGFEQLLGYLFLKIPINFSWWIGFFSILFGLCSLLIGRDLFKIDNREHNKSYKKIMDHYLENTKSIINC